MHKRIHKILVMLCGQLLLSDHAITKAVKADGTHLQEGGGQGEGEQP